MIWNQSLSKLVACVTLLLALGSCSSGGSDGGGPTTPPAPAAGSATVTGTVSGTIIKVLRADTKALISQFDTAPLPGPPPFPFTLSNIPVGLPIQIVFFSAGQTFPLYGGSPPKNVFTVQTAGPIDLGDVTMGGGIATSPNQLSNVTFGAEDLSPLPPGIEPLPATLTVTTPASATGSVIVDFTVQNFSIGGQGQPHLHIQVDGGATRHFFNGQTNNVLDNGGQPTTNVHWQSANSFRLDGLAVGQHQVTVKLATASDVEFANPDANPLPVPITINSLPVPPATLTITNPSPGASLPFGPVDVSFEVQDFTIGGQGAAHLHIYLDGGTTANHFFNVPTNQVLDGNGQPVTSVTWQSNSSFQITGLSNGSHSIRLALADAADQDLQNAEAKPPTLNITIQAPPGTSTVNVTSGTSFPSSPVRITFSVTDFTIGLAGTPHLRFSIDDSPQHDFYNGNGINSDNGVLLSGVHTHFVHWTSTNSFDLFGLAAGLHQVRLVLVDASNTELTNAGAATTQNFTVQQPPVGDLQLQSVLGGLDFPVGLSLAPDGRIFYSERLTGRIRIINPSWQLDPNACVQISVSAGGEQGLLGLTLDPEFSRNHYVYVYYTAPGATMNRVARYTESSGGCTNGTTILDNLPVSVVHNGGIIQFGPDGMLYVVIGDAEVPSNAQSLTSLAGKILRVNPDGSAPLDNPFISDPNPNAKLVYAQGIRNSYGFTFHPQTNHLWESENGPNDNDEINRIVAGGNYGWPTWRGIVNQQGFIDPILAYVSVIAPTGIIAIPGNSAIYPPVYRNNLLVAVWNDGTIRHVILSGANLDQLGGSSLAYTGGRGGLLSLMLGSDGYVYVSNGNGIFRVVPH